MTSINSVDTSTSKISFTLSIAHIILMSMVFTIVQNVSVSKIGGGKITPAVIGFAMSVICVAIYFAAHQFPLTIKTCRYKFILVVCNIQRLTQGVKIDIWITIITVLSISCILSIWKTGISFIIWFFIIWVYNLKEDDGENIPYDSININYGINSERCSINSNINSGSPIKDPNCYDKNYSASIGYINFLEKRVIDLERKVSTLENDKLQQNIVIYTFNHNLTEKLQNLEKTVFHKEQQIQSNINLINNAIISLKKRKRIRIEILKLYTKQVLIWLLPTPIIYIMKRIKIQFRACFSSLNND